MQIIRNTGNISFLTDNGDTYKIVPSEAVIDVIDSNFIQLKFGQEMVRINASTVTFTKTLTGPLTPFTGNSNDLVQILQDIFFFETVADVEAANVDYDNTVSGLAATNVQDAIDAIVIAGEIQSFADVLTINNSAGANDIDVNNNDVLNVGNIDVSTINGSSYPFAVDAINVTYIDTYGQGVSNVQDAIDDIYSDVSGIGLTQVLGVNNSAGIFDIDLNNNVIINADKIDFNLATTNTVGEGQTCWNAEDGTLDLGLKGGSVIHHIGQQTIIRAVNKTSPNIDLLKANYQAVKISGATGQRLSIALAKGDNDANSASTIGLVCEDIAKNQEGFVTTVGLIKNINTTGTLQGETWADGDLLFLSPNTFGAITNVKPIAPNHLVVIGYVEYAHNVNGKIYVKVDNGYELNELHDVAYPTAPANGEVLLYDFTQSRWENTLLNLASTIYLNKYINESSTQWSRTLAAPVPFNNGTIANGFNFFDDALHRVANGCTSYNEFFLNYGRRLTLTGTSGTANINVGGVDYLATFNTSLTQTAANFVTTHGAAIKAASGVQVFANAGVLRFGSTVLATLNAITITNVTTNLSGTFDTSIQDHVVVPYIGQPYEGLRLTHQFRVNFNLSVGVLQTVALSLRRWADDSIIGSEIQVDRNPDVSGVQENFISYTSGANDPFVTGGFYFAARNDSGVNLAIEGTVGILIITTFQKPVNF